MIRRRYNPRVSMRSVVYATAFYVLYLIAGCIFGWQKAHSHDAEPTAARPQGWSYPFACCSGFDCREVPAKAIGEKPEGYVIKGTGDVIAYTDPRIKDSPDGETHWCSVAGADNSRTICLFVPPRSY